MERNNLHLSADLRLALYYCSEKAELFWGVKATWGVLWTDSWFWQHYCELFKHIGIQKSVLHNESKRNWRRMGRVSRKNCNWQKFAQRNHESFQIGLPNH